MTIKKAMCPDCGHVFGVEYLQDEMVQYVFRDIEDYSNFPIKTQCCLCTMEDFINNTEWPRWPVSDEKTVTIWDAALWHLSWVYDYADEGYHEKFIGHVTDYLRKRYKSGDRSKDLYDLMTGVYDAQ